MGITLYAFPTTDESQYYMEYLKNYYLEPDDNYYLVEEHEDVPTYGDVGFTISARIGPDSTQLNVCFAMGSLAYAFFFLARSVPRSQRTADEVIPKVLERHFERETYSDDELYQLLPSESDTGLSISSEEFMSEANER
jgi:hypothetical protein